MMHKRMGGHFADTWNPYRRREDTSRLDLDETTSKWLLSYEGWVDGQYDCWMPGCLDAPDEIPLGATASVRTIGGWDREEYLRVNRECTDWGAHLRAEYEVAELCKQVLAELEELT
jgi:hypothetical protein